MPTRELNRDANERDDVRYRDPMIEAYKKDVDRSLLRANLRLSVAERFEHFDRFAEFAKELYDAGVRARAQKKSANQR